MHACESFLQQGSHTECSYAPPPNIARAPPNQTTKRDTPMRHPLHTHTPCTLLLLAHIHLCRYVCMLTHSPLCHTHSTLDQQLSKHPTRVTLTRQSSAAHNLPPPWLCTTVLHICSRMIKKATATNVYLQCVSIHDTSSYTDISSFAIQLQLSHAFTRTYTPTTSPIGVYGQVCFAVSGSSVKEQRVQLTAKTPQTLAVHKITRRGKRSRDCCTCRRYSHHQLGAEEAIGTDRHSTHTIL